MLDGVNTTTDKLRRARQRKRTRQTGPSSLRLEDFHALMTEHKYIFAPTGQIWPAKSVDGRLPDVGAVKASAWLDQNRPVEQMTWAPGEPQVIEDRLISDGGWFPRQGCRAFNLYKPAIIKPMCGSPDKWLCHIDALYGTDGAHIVKWCAHRVQRPHEKINHAIMLGGGQGVGKDTILEPVKRAIGPWNFVEVSPQQVLGRFNGYLKSVILRVSEARDLGDFDRYAFYDHMKSYTAAPPDVLRIDEKNRQEYSVPNVCGVIITTNYKTDGIYLPEDDRRNFVAWCDLDKGYFEDGYFKQLWGWYGAGGCEVIAHYLQGLDIGGFDPKAPPPRTEAFHEIVSGSRSPEDSEMADALDLLGEPDPNDKNRPVRPEAVTITDIIRATQQFGFQEYLKDRKNSRKVPHRFEACGYCAVRNPAADDGLWRLDNRRQVIYARNSLGFQGRLKAAKAYAGQPPVSDSQ